MVSAQCLQKVMVNLKKIYLRIGLEGQFLKTDCPYKHTFSKKIVLSRKFEIFLIDLFFSKIGR